MTEPEQASTSEEQPSDKRRRLRFWLLTLIGLTVLLPILIVTAVLLALRSETGTAWVIEQVPGLEVSNGQGSLLGRWQADNLVWQGYGVGVTLRVPLIDWSPSCLFEKQICLDVLEASAIDISIQSPGDDSQSSGPIALPALDLPIGISIGRINLGPTSFNGAVLWDDLSLSASGSGADWDLSSLSVNRDDLALNVGGRVQTRGDWPLDLTVQLELPPPYRDQWLLDLNLTGSVTELLVKGQSSGYLNAQLSGGLQPLEPSLPVRLKVQSPEFLASGALPPTLTLVDTTVTLQGSVEKGFKTSANSKLPGNQGPISLSLDGLVTTTGVSGIDVRLAGRGTGETETGTVTLNGDLDWEQALRLNARLALNAFPWFNLIPDLEAPPVILDRLNGDFLYQGDTYSANFEAVVDGPQGKANLASSLEGNLEQLSLNDLKVNTGAGFMGGSADIGFADAVSWQADLTLSQFNPGYWYPALEASLNGDVSTRGRLPAGGTPEINANWDLEGTWRASEAELRGLIQQKGPQLEVSEFTARVGENRVQGKASWGERLGADLTINLPQPSLFLSQLKGAMDGAVSISGTVDQPTGSVSVQGQSLAWDDQIELERFDLSAALASDGSLNGELNGQSLKGAGQALERLSLNLSGTQIDHTLRVEATHEEASVTMDFAGAVNEGWTAWRGQLARGEIDVFSQNQDWRLAAPAILEYAENGTLTFGKHCWLWQQASVCAGQQTLLPEQTLDYRIRNFPTTALSPLMPDALRWDTLLNADLRLESDNGNRTGSVDVDAGAGEFSVQNGEEWEVFRYNTLTAGVDLLPDRATLLAQLDGPRLGKLLAEVAVDPQSEKRNIEGRYSVAGLDLSMAGVFAKLDTVKGTLNGEGRLSGPLMKPKVYGNLVLSEGELSDSSIPLPLNDLVASLTFNGYNADVSGRWKSNARSQGQLDGTLGWASELSANLELTGQRLPFNYEPYAQVELEPDLNIVFAEGNLKISGRLAVPRGNIEITALPEQAVSVSDDEVIVGAEAEEPALRSLNMDVTVVVGEDQVSFNGFGVIGDLEGTIRIGNNMDTRGALQLVDGTFQKYGQDLELRRARLVFTGPLSEPYLDIEAIRRVDTVIAGLRLTGPVSQPETEVFSEPNMPQTDALSYLILGRAPRGQGDENAMRNAAISLGLNQASKITRGLGEEIGIRDLTLEAEGSGDEAAVVASGYLTEDLSIRYGVGLFEPITTVALRYDLGRYFYLEAASGLAASLDLFYTRDF